MRWTPLAIILVAATGCLQGTVEGTLVPDLVLENGLVWSPGMEAPRPATVVIAGAGIYAVGNEGMDWTVGDGTRVIDLDGALVLPGFRDAHMHPLRSRPLEPDFTPIPPAEEQLQSDLENHNAQASFHGGRRALHESGDYEPDTEREYGYCTPMDTNRVESLKTRFRSFEEAVAKQGITNLVVAGMSDMTQMAALKEMEADGENLVRWHIRVKSGCYGFLDAMGIEPHDGEWVRWYGVKLYGDGYLGSWVAGLVEAYSDRPLWNGVLAYTPAALDHYIAEAKARGLHIGTHAIGDATIHQVLDAYERAGVTPEDRWTIEHVQITDPTIIDRFAELGVVASIQLSFATTDIRMAEDRLGAARLAEAYDWAGLADAGVVLAGGTDYPIEVINPLWGLQREVTRQELDGTPPTPWLPDNGLDLQEALESITAGAAYAAHEDRRGRIAPDHVADIVVVKENLFDIPADTIADSTVMLTIVNGKITFEGSQSYPPPV